MTQYDPIAQIDASVDMVSGGFVFTRVSDRKVFTGSGYVTKDASGANGAPSGAAFTAYKVAVTASRWSATRINYSPTSRPALDDVPHEAQLVDSTNEVVWRDDAYNANANLAKPGDAMNLTTQAKTDVGAAVLDGAASGHNTAGTVGAKINLISLGGGGGGGGDGDTPVDHNTGGTDNYRIRDNNDQGIDEVTIRAYLKSDYDADPTTAMLKGTQYTRSDGRWVGPLMLDSGFEFTCIAYKDGKVSQTFDVDLT